MQFLHIPYIDKITFVVQSFLLISDIMLALKLTEIPPPKTFFFYLSRRLNDSPKQTAIKPLSTLFVNIHRDTVNYVGIFQDH